MLIAQKFYAGHVISYKTMARRKSELALDPQTFDIIKKTGYIQSMLCTENKEVKEEKEGLARQREKGQKKERMQLQREMV